MRVSSNGYHADLDYEICSDNSEIDVYMSMT